MATATEAWAESPLLPDLHHQSYILQTRAALKSKETRLNTTQQNE
jgi:hypothetical protein